MPLHHVPNMVTTCICLHNLYTIHQNKFNDEWTKERIRILHRKNAIKLERVDNVDFFMVATQAAKEMRKYM